MRTSSPAISGRRVLALVVGALLLGGVTVGLDSGSASTSAAGSPAAPTSASR